MDEATLRRYADLIVEVGANVQPGQVVFVMAEPRAAPFTRCLWRAGPEQTCSVSATVRWRLS